MRLLTWMALVASIGGAGLGFGMQFGVNVSIGVMAILYIVALLADEVCTAIKSKQK